MSDKLFGKAEEINGHDRHETYLYRWHVLKTKWFKIYLHHFVGDDWAIDLHDHPKRFISIGIKGNYIEETPDYDYPNIAELNYREVFNAPWIRSFPANHIHRLIVPSKSCWTIAIVLKREREWGFWHKGIFIPWLDYVNNPEYHEIAHRKPGR